MNSSRGAFGGLGARMAAQMAQAASGYGRAASVAAAAERDGERARVGARRRPRKWNAGLEGARGGGSSSGGEWTPIPLELSMVLSSSEDEGWWSSTEDEGAVR